MTYEKHGMYGKPEYISWRGMKQRCLCPTNAYFDYYGGRGISVYPEWIPSFSAFFSYIGPRPSSLHTLDRINNDGNYEPGNVRWATRKEQANNTRANVFYELNGVRKTQAAWAEGLNTTEDVLIRRLQTGWSLEETLTTPIMKEYSHASI